LQVCNNDHSSYRNQSNFFHVCHTNIHGWILGMGISLGQKGEKKFKINCFEVCEK
jgi:hypothetical protein